MADTALPLNKLLTVIKVLEPVVEDVAKWIDGSDPNLPVTLRSLPTELKSEVELRLLKARAERGR